MAAMMAVHYKKYKKIFPETGRLPGFACKMQILLIFELQTSSLYHLSDAIRASLRIWYIQDGIQNGSGQILRTGGSGTIPVGMSDGFVTDKMPCLMEKHFINTCIWINEPRMYVWLRCTVQAGISESGTCLM